MKHPSVFQMIDDHPNLSPRELAVLWLTQLGVSEEAQDVLVGACANEIRLRRRGRNREDEKRVLHGLQPHDGTPVDRDALKRFLDRGLEIRPGEFVFMGDATRADWESRKLFLEELANGLYESIRRCELAISTLDHYQVDTLRDIPTDNLPDFMYLKGS